MKKRLAIVGAGDLGLQVAHHAAIAGAHQIEGFFDDTRKLGTEVGGVPILGDIKSIHAAYATGKFDELIIAIGYRHLLLRQEIYTRHIGHIPFASIIHPSAIVDPDCEIGAGSVVYPGCVLDMGVRIAGNVLLNLGCVIAHDSSIGSGCFFSPAVKLAGFVHVDARSTLGIGSIVIDNINIASGIRTGAGAVVIDDLLEPGLYVGVPARLKKRLVLT